MRTMIWIVLYNVALIVNRLTRFTDRHGGRQSEIALALVLCGTLGVLHLPWRVSLVVFGGLLFTAAAVMQNQVIPPFQQMTALVGVIAITIAVLTWRPGSKRIGPA